MRSFVLRAGILGAAVLPGVLPGQAQPVRAPEMTNAAAAAPADSAPADSLVALVRPLFTTVETLRGNKFLHAVPVYVVTDSVAKRHFRGRIAQLESEERLANDAAAYGQLGLLPPGTDLKELYLDVLEEQAGGYYSPEDDAFYLLTDMPRAILPILAVHELTHANDDQHFGIDSTLASIEGEGDRESAYGGVVEGSGTLIMTAFMLGEMQAGRMGADILQEFAKTDAGKAAKLFAAPAALRRILLAPYLLGQSFLLRGDPSRIMSGVVAADLDRAFRDPPASTEQLLHPEKYWDDARRDPPRAVPDVDCAARLGAGWSRVGEGTLGELLLGLLAGAQDPELTSLDIATPSKWTSTGAAGWGGDHWWLYAKGEARATVLATLWDTPGDAVEFEAALVLPQGCGAWRRGSAVVVIAAAPADRAAGVAKTCLDALTSGDTAR